jgi:hypoxanthine phosphoribosyltransferase
LSFVRVSSYAGTTSSGDVKTILGLDDSVKGKTVVFVEDIIDSGKTATFLTNEINKFHPESVHWATMLVKPESLKYVIDIAYKGFEVSDDFLVGYGLDYNGIGRNLNDLYREIKINK